MQSLASVDTPPPLVEFVAIHDPIERLRALTRLAKQMGHRFPPAYAAARRAAFKEVRAIRHGDGTPRYSLRVIAGLIELGLTRTWQLDQDGRCAS